jgi:hypothetical protein
MTYVAEGQRYDSMPFRRCGASGLDLPAISLGLWHNFGDDKSLEVQRAIAGILIRADYQAIAKPELVEALRTHRRKSADGQDLIDILIRRLQASLRPAASRFARCR